MRHSLRLMTIVLACSSGSVVGATNSTASASDDWISENNHASDAEAEQLWNWHAQNTDIVQGYPGFSAKYSGPNSLHNGGQVRETISVDLYAGVRLWKGSEAHVDGLMWQGFGLSKTR